MTTIFAALAGLYTSSARCANALGISRQAYSQAQRRRKLSTAATIKAAALLGIDPAAALLANATAQDMPAPILNAAAHPCDQIQGEKKPLQPQAEIAKNNAPTTNYARF